MDLENTFTIFTGRQSGRSWNGIPSKVVRIVGICFIFSNQLHYHENIGRQWHGYLEETDVPDGWFGHWRWCCAILKYQRVDQTNRKKLQQQQDNRPELAFTRPKCWGIMLPVTRKFRLGESKIDVEIFVIGCKGQQDGTEDMKERLEKAKAIYKN